MIRVAFAGFRHPHIISLYRELADSSDWSIVASCEEDEFSAARLLEDHDIAVTHRNFQTMLDGVDFDVLAVGDYYAIRGSRVIAGLRKGVHVISDKPLCTGLDELTEIGRLSSANHLAIGLMLDFRMTPNVLAAREFIHEGGLGDIFSIQFGGQHQLNYGTRASWYFEPGKHGGTINDISIHGLDAVEFITGLKISGLVAARSWNGFAAAVPHFMDSAQLMFRLGERCGVMGDVSYAAPCGTGFVNPFYWRFTIWGSLGVLEFNYNTPGVRLYLGGRNDIAELPGLTCTAECNYLEIFKNEVYGGHDPLGTEHILRLTEYALKLQRMSEQVVANECQK